MRQQSAVANFYDAEEVRSVYYPEVERLVREFTGAVKVHVFDHNVRSRPMAKLRENGAQEPVKVAHNDYTLKSGPQRVRDLLPDEADALLKNRFAVINVWRPIRGPVQESPLAVCDAQSMVQDDFVKHVLKYRDRDGEVYSVAYNPNHRWYYIPNQQKEEVLLLKCYDSDGRRARFTAHSAFEDPSSPPDAAPRESVEVRTLVFFPAWRRGLNRHQRTDYGISQSGQFGTQGFGRRPRMQQLRHADATRNRPARSCIKRSTRASRCSTRRTSTAIAVAPKSCWARRSASAVARQSSRPNSEWRWATVLI